jgi:hypothetical protein
MAFFCMAALVVSGCGGDSSTGSGVIETSTIGRQQFIHEADAICASGSRWVLKQLSNYVEDRKAEGSKQSEAELVSEALKQVGLPRVQAAIDDIEALGAPRGDEAQLEAFLTQLQQETDALQNKSQLSMKAVFAEGFTASGNLAREYGLKACAYG